MLLLEEAYTSKHTFRAFGGDLDNPPLIQHLLQQGSASTGIESVSSTATYASSSDTTSGIASSSSVDSGSVVCAQPGMLFEPQVQQCLRQVDSALSYAANSLEEAVGSRSGSAVALQQVKRLRGLALQCRTCNAAGPGLELIQALRAGEGPHSVYSIITVVAAATTDGEWSSSCEALASAAGAVFATACGGSPPSTAYDTMPALSLPTMDGKPCATALGLGLNQPQSQVSWASWMLSLLPHAQRPVMAPLLQASCWERWWCGLVVVWLWRGRKGKEGGRQGRGASIQGMSLRQLWLEPKGEGVESMAGCQCAHAMHPLFRAGAACCP